MIVLGSLYRLPFFIIIIMTFLDKYKDCRYCPVNKYCGTMVGSIRLCNSYESNSLNDDKRKKL